MASVVFTSPQIAQIATYFAQKQFGNTTATCATVALDALESSISSLAMSISIGGGSVSYSPAFTGGAANLTTAQQAALISYILMQAMGVPLT